MKAKSLRDGRGITLVELLIALVVFGLVSAGTYRLFVGQTRAYAVQDQVVEVQQNSRTTMEILLRDLRMAGYDSDGPGSHIDITSPIVAGDQSITVSYEYDNSTQHTVTYSRDAATSQLFRQLTTTTNDGVNPPVVSAGAREPLLDGVDSLNFSYGIDYDSFGNEDGMVDYWETDSTKIGGRRVVAVRVQLTARPEQVNPDVEVMISPRTLESRIAIRNLALKH